jgi:hypothetical protein
MNKFFLLLFCISLKAVTAQNFTPNNYPKNYFRLPLNIAPSLAGNFGGLRTNHYHMGLDLRTQQKENLAVLAAADGYISRIKIEPYGYGRAIYITHPNGLVTLYAHLNKFMEPLQNYVTNKQYANQKWQQDFELTPTQFIVKKGQFIAYSGNTGGSEGPHLHFEIRDAKTGKNYNPLLFGLGITDNVKPTITRLALYNRNESIYENAPQIVKIKKSKKPNEYELATKILKVPIGKFSLGITADDKMSQSFTLGIYRATLYIDSVLACEYTHNNYVYDDSRYINAGIDYTTKYNEGPYIMHLSKLPNNQLAIYDTTATQNGIINLTDTLVHSFKIVIKDASYNTCTLQGFMQIDSMLNFAKINQLPTVATLLPGIAGQFTQPQFEIKLSEKSIYDTLHVRYSNYAKQQPFTSAKHSFASYNIPVHDYVTVRIKANNNTAANIKEKTVMVLESGKKIDAKKGIWNGEWLEAKWNYFGDYMLWYDDIAPQLRPINIFDSAVFVKDEKIVFAATDETSDIASAEAFLDDQWIILRQSKDYYVYDFDYKCPLGWHTIKIVVKDVAGNTTTQVYRFHKGEIPKVKKEEEEPEETIEQ